MEKYSGISVDKIANSLDEWFKKFDEEAEIAKPLVPLPYTPFKDRPDVYVEGKAPVGDAFDDDYDDKEKKVSAKPTPWANWGYLTTPQLIPWFVEEVLRPRVVKLLDEAEKMTKEGDEEQKAFVPQLGIDLLDAYYDVGMGTFLKKFIKAMNNMGYEKVANEIGLGGDFTWPNVKGDVGPNLLKALFGTKKQIREMAEIYPQLEDLKPLRKQTIDKRERKDPYGAAKKAKEMAQEWVKRAQDPEVDLDILMKEIMEVLRPEIQAPPGQLKKAINKTESLLVGFPGNPPLIKTPEALIAWIYEFILGGYGFGKTGSINEVVNGYLAEKVQNQPKEVSI